MNTLFTTDIAHALACRGLHSHSLYGKSAQLGNILTHLRLICQDLRRLENQCAVHIDDDVPAIVEQSNGMLNKH
jgi:hypothetical protein